MERKRVAEASKGVGRPKVGGRFELKDHEGRIFTDQDLKGRFTLVCGHSVLLTMARKELCRKRLEGVDGAGSGHNGGNRCANMGGRSTLASRIARTSALRNSIKWPA